MTADYALEHEHELDAEYLEAADVTVLDVVAEEDSTVVELVVPCPTCSDPLAVTSRVEKVTEADLELPLEDEEDAYD